MKLYLYRGDLPVDKIRFKTIDDHDPLFIRLFSDEFIVPDYFFTQERRNHYVNILLTADIEAGINLYRKMDLEDYMRYERYPTLTELWFNVYLKYKAAMLGIDEELLHVTSI